MKAGSAWTGYLAPGGSGTSESPFTVSRYGDGAKPKIDGEGRWMAALYLLNVQGWEVSDLDIANKGAGAAPNLCGVLAKLDNFGTARHVHLKNLDVHDVTGSNVKSDGGGNGIHFTSGGEQTKSRFDDLLIENCHLTRTDRNGITGNGYWSRKDWFPHLNVVIRGNLLEDFGGDGIVPIACDGALVEHNVLRGGRQRCDDYAAGIWPWSCDNTVIQFNEVSGMKGTKDGQGFDSDWNCRNTLIQYNYSHDNDGGFLLICNDGTSKMPYNIGNVGTVVRYNISQNDGARTFNISGPCRDTQIYNNTIFIGPKLTMNLVLPGDWGGDWTESTRFANNIFSVEGKAKFDFGGMRKTVFENNVFHGNIENRPADATAIVADPKLTAPGTGTEGCKLAPNSPAKGAGLVIENNGGRDFFGNKLPVDKPDVGAVQL